MELSEQLAMLDEKEQWIIDHTKPENEEMMADKLKKLRVERENLLNPDDSDQEYEDLVDDQANLN